MNNVMIFVIIAVLGPLLVFGLDLRDAIKKKNKGEIIGMCIALVFVFGFI